MIIYQQHKAMADPAPDLKRKYNSQKELSDNTKNSALNTKEKEVRQHRQVTTFT